MPQGRAQNRRVEMAPVPRTANVKAGANGAAAASTAQRRKGHRPMSERHGAGRRLAGLQDLLAQVDALRSRSCRRRAAVWTRFACITSKPWPAACRLRRLRCRQVLQAKLAAALKALGGGAETARPLLIRIRSKRRRCHAPRACRRAHRTPWRRNGPSPKPGQKRHRPPPRCRCWASSTNTSNGVSAVRRPAGQTASPQDLKSAVRFRETWARISAETEVDKAAHRAPENAGPLNAHNLVLRTLALMRELSPDYLRRFMGHTESLLWLDQAYGQLKQPAGKAKAGKGGQTRM